MWALRLLTTIRGKNILKDPGMLHCECISEECNRSCNGNLNNYTINTLKLTQIWWFSSSWNSVKYENLQNMSIFPDFAHYKIFREIIQGLSLQPNVSPEIAYPIRGKKTFKTLACCIMSVSVMNASASEILRLALFLVQVISDISKQDCIHSKQIPQCTKREFAFIINNFNEEQKSPIHSYIKPAQNHNLWKYYFIWDILAKMQLLCHRTRYIYPNLYDRP